jgi:hypothetical protein
MPDNRYSFWNTVARYCAELAPVVGPIVAAAGDVAAAIERADTAALPSAQRRALPVRSESD